jgi:hypothetical protein
MRDFDPTPEDMEPSMYFRKQAVAFVRIPVLAPQPPGLKWQGKQVLALSFKRILDIVLAATMLFVLMPVMVVIAAAVAMDGGPVIYRHRRIGRDGKAFDCLKFQEWRAVATRYEKTARSSWAFSVSRHSLLDQAPIGVALQRYF